jgi:DNA modification methylase
MSIEFRHGRWQPGLTELNRPADLVICDPVYDNKDLDYVAAAVGVLRPGGSLYVFGDHAGIAQTKLALDAQPELAFANWLIWGPNDWGGRSRTRWGQKHDDILFYTKNGASHTFNVAAVSVPKKMTQARFNPSGRQTKIPHSVWSDLGGFSTVASERVRIGGTAVRWQKPERVIERIVLASSNPGDLVVDPFGGVATVPVVCARLARNCVSFESDAGVFAAGQARLQSVIAELASHRS